MSTVIISGSRHLTDASLVMPLIEEGMGHITSPVTLIRHGAAPGVDTIADAWARERGIAVERWPADWESHGRSAGPRRNAAMIARGADLMIAIPLDSSSGTRDAIKRACAARLPTCVFELTSTPEGPRPRPGVMMFERATTVISKHREIPSDLATLIIRGTPWGNPYTLQSRAPRDVVKCLLLYARHLLASGVVDQVHQLRGRVLVCVCAPARCHGDVLARCADAEDPHAELAIIIEELERELAALPAQGVLL